MMRKRNRKTAVANAPNSENESGIQPTRYQIDSATTKRGGFGRVARGFDTILQRTVAVKTLDPIWAGATETDRERFQREARTLASLRHPSIPAIYDVEFSDTEFRIIFEYIEGDNLRKIISTEPLSLFDAQGWFIQVASALHHAHEQGIIHRDVKPENLIVTESRLHCYLVDFGIALSVTDQQRLSKSGQVLGTPGYMSPEQEDGDELDASSDVYVLGVCLYEALLGHRIPAGEYEALSDQIETIPPAVDALILKCIAPKYQRIKSALEFARQLNRATHVRAALPDVLGRGHLQEIIAVLREMSPQDFMKMKAGQRLLALSKALDVIKTDDAKLDRARYEFCRILPLLAMHVDRDLYGQLIEAVLPWAFDRQTGKWIGDEQTRKSLQEASYAIQANHDVLSARLLDYLQDQGIEDKQPWFYHTIREIIEGLMANEYCEDSDAKQLDGLLQRINRLQREGTGTFEFPDK